MAYTEPFIVLGQYAEITAISLTATSTGGSIHIPFSCQLEEVLFVVTTTLGTQTTDAVVKLRKKVDGGADTDLVSLTIGAQNTTLKKGDGTREAQTAITASANLTLGSIVYPKRTTVPVQLGVFDILHVDVSTAAAGGAPAGAIVPIILVRPAIDMRQTTSWVDTATTAAP